MGVYGFKIHEEILSRQTDFGANGRWQHAPFCKSTNGPVIRTHLWDVFIKLTEDNLDVKTMLPQLLPLQVRVHIVKADIANLDLEVKS